MNELLRNSLVVNAGFSLSCGIAALYFADSIALGLAAPLAVVYAVGVMLIVFAIAVATLARLRASSWAGFVIGLDLAWVIGSVVVLVVHPMPNRALVIGPAIAVAALALAQWAGLWRVRRVDLRRTVQIAGSPAAAWAIVGERFGQISEWAAPILDSSLDGELAIGAERTCVVGGFGPVPAGQVTERLIDYDASARVLEYVVTSGMPGFISHASNRWTTTATRTGCAVSSHAVLEVRWPMSLVADVLAWKFAADGQAVLDEFRHRVEQDRPHPRKLASRASLIGSR